MCYIANLPYTDTIKEKLHVLIDLLMSSCVKCTKIVLFGIYARMEQRVGSDLDILALTDIEVCREVRGELCSKFDELGSDLIFYTNRVFEDSNSLLLQHIKKEDILLWEN